MFLRISLANNVSLKIDKLRLNHEDDYHTYWNFIFVETGNFLRTGRIRSHNRVLHAARTVGQDVQFDSVITPSNVVTCGYVQF